MAIAGAHTDDKRPPLFVGNRWVNTIYTGYGIVKQKILLQILEQLQGDIKKVMNGSRVNFPNVPVVLLQLDMSKICHYNNYHWVRKAVKEMCSQEIKIYNDNTFKQDIYVSAPLLHTFHQMEDKKIITLQVKRNIAELLIHVDFNRAPKDGKKPHAFQYTSFDRFTIDHSSSKYMFPLYTMVCSYAERGGFEMKIDELREHLQVEEKYRGFDNFHRFVLRHVQKELEKCGQYCFNYTLIKKGRDVTRIVFKIFKNKKQFDYNDVWMKIYRTLRQDLPYYMRFNEDQLEQFNYLLTGEYDLDAVLAKLIYVHKALVKRKDAGDAVNKPFIYTIQAIHKEFPPG